MQKKVSSYFHNKVLIRLFLSYALIIVIFLAVYVGLYMTICSAFYRSAAERDLQQKTDTWGMLMGRQLLSAQSVCSAVNTSENTRSIFSDVYVEGSTIDPMQMYKMLNGLKGIKGASTNRNIYTAQARHQPKPALLEKRHGNRKKTLRNLLTLTLCHSVFCYCHGRGGDRR